MVAEQLAGGGHARQPNARGGRQDVVSPAVTVLDGGLATELERRGHDLSDSLWSARLLQDDPAAVREAHLAFFRAGAHVATTASYQASFDGFMSRGLSRSEAAGLMRSSVALAREAAQLAAAEQPSGVRRQVAASVGPFGALRADGSEYSGDYGVSDALLRDVHGPRMEVLATSGADFLAIETIPSEQEVTVLLDLLGSMPEEVCAWLSVTCADGAHTRRGEDISRVFSLARGVDRLVAVGVNCTPPTHIEQLVTAAVSASGKAAIAYPNSGESWDARTRSWKGDAAGVSLEHARRWVTAGAEWVGGCCRVSSADIARLSAGLGPDYTA